MTTEQQPIRLDIPRHLQDFNGYCGPACALMVIDFAGSKKSPPVFAQNEFFREVRSHAKQAADRRPIKSPAESLLHLLNDHADGETKWEKIYQEDSLPVAEAILQAVERQAQPSLMMVNRGMHWVVAFGMLKKPDGTPSGLLMRDPAWAGMPKFYGISVFPEEPAIEHCQSPCSCLEAINANKNKRTGKVHERFFTINELLSHRGLKGSLDWEGNGAIALVPEGSKAAAARIPAHIASGVGALGAPIANAQEKAGQAALTAIRESGLTGRPDSPPEWDQALNNARAGEPILVKDPEDSRDDFFLVPLMPEDSKAKNGAWAMLDAHTLELREISLLEDWQAPVLPTPEEAQQASNQDVHLPDGTTQNFSAKDLTPNQQNLVWQPSAAAALPYWPVKEFTAPHPVSGEPVSVYLTQDGKVHGHLGPDEGPQLETPKPEAPKTEPKTPSNKPPKPNRLAKIALTTAVAAGIPTAFVVTFLDDPSTPQPHVGGDDNDDNDDNDGSDGGDVEEQTSANLLKNPGFENQGALKSFATVVSDFSAYKGQWGPENGSIVGPEGAIRPIGSKMHSMQGSGIASQTIQITSLADFASEIAAGQATFDLEAMFNFEGSGVSGSLAVRFFKANWGTPTGTIPSNFKTLDNQTGTWEKAVLSGKIPPDAMWMGTELQFNSAKLNGNPGYVDDAKLTITVTR